VGRKRWYRAAARAASAGLALAGLASVSTGAARVGSTSTLASADVWQLGGATPFPWGFYVGGPMMLSPATGSAVDTTGDAAIGGLLVAPFGRGNFTVNAPGCVELGSACDSLAAPSIAGGSQVNVQTYDVAVGPGPIRQQGITVTGGPGNATWTLYDNGNGKVAKATPDAPLDFTAQTTYLEQLDAELSQLPPTLLLSAADLPTPQNGETLTVSVPASSGPVAVVNLSEAIASMSASGAHGVTLVLDVPSGVTLVVQLPAVANLTPITTVDASLASATHTIFVAAPPSPGGAQQITLYGSRNPATAQQGGRGLGRLAARTVRDRRGRFAGGW